MKFLSKLKVNESRYKHCGVTPHISTGKNIQKKNDKWGKIKICKNYWLSQFRKTFDRSADHKQSNMPWLIKFKEHGSMVDLLSKGQA